MSFQYVDGQAGKVSLNTVGGTSGTATTLSVTSWKVTDSTNAQDVTATTSGGYYVPQGVIRKLEIELEAFWDSTLYPYATTPNLVPNTLVQVDLYAVATSTNPTYACPKALVLSVDPTIDASGVVKYSCKLSNYGAFTTS